MSIADQLRRVAYAEPFKPFRVRLVNGEEIRIPRSLRTSVAADRVVFGVDEDPATGTARRMRMIPIRDIASVDVTPER